MEEDKFSGLGETYKTENQTCIYQEADIVVGINGRDDVWICVKEKGLEGLFEQKERKSKTRQREYQSEAEHLLLTE